MGFVGVLIVFMIALGIYGAVTRKKNKDVQIAAELSKDIVSLDGKILHVEKQCRHLRKLLAVKNHPVASVKYNEEKIHVGAVTVGGVTTGGAYKTGGDYSVRELNSERCELVFQRSVGLNFDLETTPIKRIYLSKQLAEKAKGTPVEKYVRGGSIDIIGEIQYSSTVGVLMRMGRTSEALTQSSIEDAERYPTREKCDAIIDFLSAE